MQARCWPGGQRWPGFLFFALLTALCTSAASACDRPLRVAMAQFPPYILRDARGAASGAEPELLRAILQQAGCQLEIVPDLPRKRRYAMFLAGELDILLAASETVERREVAWFTPPYRMETTAWFALPARAAALRELDGFGAVLQRRITMVTQNLGWFGVEYATLLPQLQQAKLISQYENTRQGLSMLLAARGEILMADRGATLYEAAQRGLELAELPFVPAREPVHLMLSKKSVSEADARAIGNAVQLLEERGVLKEIRGRYGLR